MTRQEINRTIESICGLAYKNLTEHFCEIFGKFYALQNEYRKAVLKRNTDEPIFFKPIERKNNGFTYIIYPKTYGKRDFKKYGIIFHLVTPFYVDGKPYYVRYSMKDKTEYFVFTHHFFERYIQRYLNNAQNLSIIDVIKDYLKKTDSLNTLCDCKEGGKYENQVLASSLIGVECGERINDNTVLFRTFLNKDSVKYGAKYEAKKVFEELEKVAFDKQGKRIAFLPNMNIIPQEFSETLSTIKKDINIYKR